MKDRKSKLSQIIFYSASVYLGQLFKGLSSIFLSGFLGPVGRGQYSYTNLYYQYLQYGSLGVRYSTDKNLPIIYDKNDKEKIREYEIKSKSSLFIIQLMISIIMIIYVIFFENPQMKLLLVVTILSSLFFYINEFYKVIYRAEQNVKEISKYTIYYYSITGIIQLISVYFLKLNGAIYSIFICNILFYIIFFKKLRFKEITFNFDYNFTKFMIKDGFVLFINGLTVFTMMNLDKFFIINFSSNKDLDLGLYTFATMFFGMFQILPGCIAEVLFPDLLIRINKQTQEQVGNYVFKCIKIISKVFFIIIGLSIILYPIFVKLFMKEYLNSINLFQIIIIGIYFISIQSLCSYVLIGLGKKNYVLIISASSLLLSCVLYILMIKILEFSLIIIALCVAITYFVYCLIYLIIVYINYKNEIHSSVGTIFLEIVKLVILVLVNVLLQKSALINLMFIIDMVIVGIGVGKVYKNSLAR